MRETITLEFKEALSDSFLKTVSAFANYGGGTILFGVTDEGSPIGIANPSQKCLDIENKINDSVSPHPEFTLNIKEPENVIELKVEPGLSKPYLFRSKAYKRSDTSTVEVDQIELTRLILEGKSLSFDQLPSKDQNLTFGILGDALCEHLGLNEFDNDTLRTLNLLSKAGDFNNAAAILADANGFPGIDIVQFGESINIIRQRKMLEGASALTELSDAMEAYESLYCYEQIDGLIRSDVELIPRDAYREAVANAIVHRTWDVPARIRIAMFDDRIEITSPGGLPTGLTAKEYAEGKISQPRNQVLANVFFRLGIIETLGTGILRIKETYSESTAKPRFDVTDNTIQVVLPVVKANLNLGKDQQVVYDLLSLTRPMGSRELADRADFSRTKLNGILRQLVEQGVAKATGSGRSTRYLRL